MQYHNINATIGKHQIHNNEKIINLSVTLNNSILNHQTCCNSFSIVEASWTIGPLTAYSTFLMLGLSVSKVKSLLPMFIVVAKPLRIEFLPVLANNPLPINDVYDAEVCKQSPLPFGTDRCLMIFWL